MADWTDDESGTLNRGGHDLQDLPPTIAPQTQGPADADPGQDHQGLWHGRRRRGDEHQSPAKKLDHEQMRRFRDRFWPAGAGRQAGRPAPTSPSDEDSPGIQIHLRSTAWRSAATCRTSAQGRAAGRAAAARRFDALLKASGEGRELSTTMAIVRIMNTLLKDKQVGKNVSCRSSRRIAHLRHGRHVPPVGIWNQEGQNYVPETMTS